MYIDMIIAIPFKGACLAILILKTAENITPNVFGNVHNGLCKFKLAHLINTIEYLLQDRIWLSYTTTNKQVRSKSKLSIPKEFDSGHMTQATLVSYLAAPFKKKKKRFLFFFFLNGAAR